MAQTNKRKTQPAKKIKLFQFSFLLFTNGHKKVATDEMTYLILNLSQYTSTSDFFDFLRYCWVVTSDINFNTLLHWNGIKSLSLGMNKTNSISMQCNMKTESNPLLHFVPTFNASCSFFFVIFFFSLLSHNDRLINYCLLELNPMILTGEWIFVSKKWVSLFICKRILVTVNGCDSRCVQFTYGCFLLTRLIEGWKTWEWSFGAISKF